jgi:DNA-3-methyladenine glycosylase
VTVSQVPNIRAVRSADDLFTGSTIEVAQRLVGATLERVIPAGEPDAGAILRGRIVETEAYLPNVDPACHAYRGPTKRAVTLFGRPGRAYVYLIYGVNFCLNVVTEPPGVGAAVLVRALEPLDGIESMRRRRPGVPDDLLVSGPGNLCKAMAIDLRCNGIDFRLDSQLRLTFETSRRPVRLGVAKRVGLSSAIDWPLRFYDPDSVSVSKAPRASKTVDATRKRVL